MLALTIREKNGEERQLIFEKEEVTIGRATGSDIVLPRSNISKRHARLVDKHDKVVIVDLRSTNGTYVNGRRITAPELLTYEDKVFIGDFVIRLSRPAEQHPSQRMTAPYSASPTPAEPRAARASTAAVDPVEPDFDGEEAAPEVAPAPRAKPVVPARHLPPSPPPMEVDEDESTRAISAMPDDEEEEPPKKAPAPLPPARKEAPPTPPTAPAKKEVPLPPPVSNKVASAPVAPLPPPRPPAPPKPAVSTAKAPRPAIEEEDRTVSAPPVIAPKKAAPPRPPEPEPEPEPETIEAELAPAGEAGDIDPWVEWNAAIQAVVERVEAFGEALPEDLEQAIA
ncbi:MAG: FHA domain-containing protein, partial [Deltaproteobacteria bacterium]|nr:FHA domain-containing protein [Deltaproteobacteria bacterium]